MAEENDTPSVKSLSGVKSTKRKSPKKRSSSRPVAKRKSTAKKEKPKQNKSEQVANQQFWPWIVLGVAIIIILFMFVRTFVHNTKNDMADTAVDSTATEESTVSEEAPSIPVTADEAKGTTIDSGRQLMEQRRMQYQEMWEKIMSRMEAERESYRKRIEEQRLKGGESSAELQQQFEHIEQLHKKIQKEMTQLKETIESQKINGPPPPMSQGFYYPPNPGGYPGH